MQRWQFFKDRNQRQAFDNAAQRAPSAGIKVEKVKNILTDIDGNTCNLRWGLLGVCYGLLLLWVKAKTKAFCGLTCWLPGSSRSIPLDSSVHRTKLHLLYPAAPEMPGVASGRQQTIHRGHRYRRL
jgi:hypothetical protein